MTLFSVYATTVATTTPAVNLQQLVQNIQQLMRNLHQF
jgi:hypothetical protein